VHLGSPVPHRFSSTDSKLELFGGEVERVFMSCMSFMSLNLTSRVKALKKTQSTDPDQRPPDRVVSSFTTKLLSDGGSALLKLKCCSSLASVRQTRLDLNLRIFSINNF